MTPLRRLVRPVLYATGGCLLVGSLLGARLLTQAEPGGDPKPKTAAPVQAVGIPANRIHGQREGAQAFLEPLRYLSSIGTDEMEAALKSAGLDLTPRADQ